MATIRQRARSAEQPAPLVLADPRRPSGWALRNPQTAAARRAAARLDNDRGGLVRQTHSLYEHWSPIWRDLGYLYEGDGPYADGRALVPHPREIDYVRHPDGRIDYTQAAGETEKLKRRRQLASYENIAQIIIDSITEHQYVRHPRRTATEDRLARDYLEWCRDVDGLGTPMDDWLEINQALAHLYGYIFVIVDRLPSALRRDPRSAAEEERLVLRSYIPQDVPDWVSVRGELRAVKTIDPRPRSSLWENSTINSNTGRGSGDYWRYGGRELEYRFWDDDGWQHYDSDGNLVDHSEHNLGTVQAVIFYSRRRARIPVIGRSLLRNPDPFKDHYNLLSEFRELLRSNTFSMLSIQLAQDETVDDARQRLGEVISSESVIFSRGGVGYIAPPGGPTATYLSAISRVEQQIFRLVNLPSSGDSHVAEAADSRRIKALSLNRTLSRAADEAERAENRICRLWHMLTYGREDGMARLAASGLRIEHPQEFFAQEVAETIRDSLDTMKIGLGSYANMLVRRAALPIVVPNLATRDRDRIHEQLEGQAKREEQAGDPFGGINPATGQPNAPPGGGGGAGTRPASGAPGSRQGNQHRQGSERGTTRGGKPGGNPVRAPGDAVKTPRGDNPASQQAPRAVK